MKQRRISSSEEKIYKKYGTAPLMHVKDSATGEVLYSDKDVHDVAKFAAARGGPAANDNTIGFSTADQWVEDNFQEKYKCDSCSKEYFLYVSSIYQGQKFNDGTVGIRCSYCWQDNAIRSIPEDRVKELELKFQYIDRYVQCHYNDRNCRENIIKEYIEAKEKQ